MVNAEFESSIDEISHSMVFGARFNPKGEFGVLYLSLSVDCCFKEKIKQVGTKNYLKAQTVGTFEFRFERCLDLTEKANLVKLEIETSKLVVPDDFNEPQILARETRRVGFEAIVAPSAVGEECRNIVVFKDKLGRKSFCELKNTKPYKF